MKKFLVAIAKDDGAVELFPMKEWLRRNSDEMPPGLDATMSTSHQLRSGLKRKGWSEQDTGAEVRLSPPGNSGVALLESAPGPADENVDAEMSSETAFSLEHQLRDFIAQNLDAIEVGGRRLRLYVDPTGVDGVEYRTAVGPIDILAEDVRDNALVVFELKRGRTPDYVIGQIARYMGWLKSTIGRERPVRGVVVAKEIAENLKYAVKAVPDVSLFEYQVSFTLNPAPSK